MAEELKVLKIQLESIHRRLNRVQQALLLDLQVPNRNRESRYFLQLQLKTIESAYAEYNTSQQRIYCLNVGEDIREETEEAYIAFESLYGELYVLITELLDETIKKEEIEANREAVVPAAAAPVNGAHLPPLRVPLPTFDGTYENWYAFKSMFETIMNRYQFESPAIKLYHLRNSLTGKAAGIIDQEILNNNDYLAAWGILTARFEDRRMIIDKHIDSLFDLPKLMKENVTDLRKLVDTCTKNVDALKNLGLPVIGLGESMLINRIASKLDNETRKAWELNQTTDELPNYESTLDFLRERCRVLEKIKPSEKSVKMDKPLRFTAEPKLKTTSLVTTTGKCLHCSGSHELWRCEDYKKANLSDRYTTLRRTGACFNCLQKGHRTTECTSEHSCKRCGKRHHTTLHNDEDRSKNHEERPTTSSNKATQQMTIVEETVVAPTHEESKKPDSSSTFCTQIQATNQQMLLSTAVILVQGKEGNTYPCRVLLDSGSQTNFISEQFTQLLSLKKESANVSVSGLNDIRTRIRFKIQTTIRSRISNYAVCLELLVVPKITGNLPLTKVDVLSLTLPAGAELADPYYNVPGRVDMLLGAEIFYDMLMLGRLRLPNSTALLQETQFGWVLSGPVPNENRKSVSSFCTTIDEDIGEIVNRFWQIESYCESQNEISSTEAECIQHFQETHERTVEGRYVVRLPFNELKPQLGDSRNMAIKRFQGLEQRLDKNPEMKHQYTEFLREYESLGHMKEITLDVTEDPRTVYYLPHHYVLKPSSSTTKLRVVFDGSAASDSGVSINQTQMIGPCVQNDLVSILLNFRSYKYAFTADIPKMYRQVGVNKDDRENLNQSLRTFDPQTVTYGLKSSPFLATMVLCQLADDEEENFPMAANVVKRSSYMDDVLTGANTLEGAIELKNQVAGLLAKGCFDIHKFCSNSEELLSEIPEEKREDGVNFGNSNFNVLMKTLGVAWDPQDDMFTFLVPVDIPWTSYLTKRKILSQIAKIFDPLGFLGPVITSAKIIMRELWSLDLQWDQPVPTEMEQLWGEFHRQLCSLNDVRIPRWIFCEEVCEYELHGFADASDLAYGACIYSRLLRRDGTVNMRLLCSKSRILPKKKEKQKQITTPRAELLAAVLVSKLAVKLLAALDTKFQHVVLWSDSQIVLCWISKSLDALPVYVGNRVREIQQLTGSFIWRYIPSKENPADLISRGVPPQDLAQCQIWWYGPPALQSTHPAIQPPEPIADEDVPEIKRIVLLTSPIQPSPHFGGIWEAGVKSTKFHLKSVLAEHKLSYEELSTVLAQIEAILNSRPLTPVSNDPNDYSAITPAHFLIGRELHAIPEPSYSHIPAGRLSRWQFVQDLKQKFWKRWVNDYLHELQTRQKDFKVTKFRVGALVLLVDENTSSLRWALGRITELCPGPDGHTRVVRLKTQNGTTTRAVKKVCLLPLDNEEP
ncbi:uncharacterized protein LOC131433081 [Malaya genurostris]|uniref:uncharacterized protein LOC131433081 n=1 Tax=Malaya genurostris TaxID=325434 RepID=UPI0026F3D303|nr:uncharacterized protein LOC131433081 [Malaya genurostris]